MIKSFKFYIFLIAANIFSIVAFAQNTTIRGEVRNSATGEPVPAVSVTVKSTNAGTYTNDKGNFILSVNKSLPLTLTISSIGFKLQEVSVTSAADMIYVN